MQIEECPVLYPSWKQFQNFHQFVEKIDRKYKSRYGMVKVITFKDRSSCLFSPYQNIIQVVPPSQWKSRCATYNQKLQNLMISGPIEQNIFGKGGVYECLHIQKKSMSLKEYKIKMGVFDKITEGLSASEVETLFWKNIVFSPPLYGADLLNTLMDETSGPWNLNHLDSLLKYAIDVNVKGVTSSYCYIGSWKTLFCWHKEDLDLASINYIHQGKSKFWYTIPPNQSHIIEKEARNYFPEHFSKCSEHLRHKTTLINPYILKKKYPQLNISKIEHRAGEFMLILGGSYHCGFNFGCNIAEAINYATLDWLGQLQNTKNCKCSHNNVRASHLHIYQNLQNSKFAKTKEFLNFKEMVYKQVEKEEEQEERVQEQKGVKSVFSKKIKKEKRIPKKIKFHGEEYEIDNWVQCDHCNVWRKVSNDLHSKSSFRCSNIGKNCNSRDKIQEDYIIL